MTRTVLEAVKLNVWLAWVSSARVEDVVVTAVDEVTTYLLLNVRRVAETGVTDAAKNNAISTEPSIRALRIFILFLPLFVTSYPFYVTPCLLLVISYPLLGVPFLLLTLKDFSNNQ